MVWVVLVTVGVVDTVAADATVVAEAVTVVDAPLAPPKTIPFPGCHRLQLVGIGEPPETLSDVLGELIVGVVCRAACDSARLEAEATVLGADLSTRRRITAPCLPMRRDGRKKNRSRDGQENK